MDQPFPELEVRLCYKILKKMNISHLANLDKDDVVQEILLSILEDKEKWMELRNKSTSTTLIYTSLRNRILDLLDKVMTASDIGRHSPKEAATEVYNQIKNEYGNVWDTYSSLSEAERGFVKDFYNPNQTIKRIDLMVKYQLNGNQASKASRKVLRTARLDITYRTLVSLDQGDYNV